MVETVREGIRELAFLRGGGEMGRLTRSHNWLASELGEPSGWPQSLKTMLGIILHSKFPMFLWWGPNLLCFYNDAYRPSLGNNGKHPAILGMPAAEAWPEIWDFISPLIRQIFDGSEAVFFEDLLVPIFRNGKMEDVYWTFSYSPVGDESGLVAGVLVTCTETTHKVEMLRDLRLSEERFQNDVSEKIATQKSMETALEQLRLSLEAAQLGLFDMDLIKGTMEWDKRCRTLFGISHNEKVTYEDDFVNGLHEDDRERITAIISDLFVKGNAGEYDVEYRTVGADDGRIRWVRAKGKVYFDSSDRAVRFIGSVIDITHQKINEQRKNDFIAMVSHELKTPLTSLTGYMQFLLRELDAEKSELEYDILQRASAQTKKMAGLINGFLNLSRFETGKLELQLSTFGINDLVGEVISDISAGVKDARIGFLPGAPVNVTADREKIGSVVNNLLSNAVKYSPSSRDIVVKCEYSEGLIHISVADAGIGIKSEDLPYIFDRFYRVENDHMKDISGFGIGLYLSSEIVKFHGGRIWVESEFGSGSTFHFCIPVKG
jgi:two-component system, OmpR family, sensor histidine kinase VicK